MDDVKQEGTLSAECTQQNETDEQTKGLQGLLAGLFKGKDTESKETKDLEETSETESKLKGQSLKKEDVTAAIAEAKKQWLSELEEMERKKGLSPDQAAKEESEAAKNEMASLRQQLLERDLRTKATNELDKLGYPVGLAELLKYENEENMTKSLTVVQDVFEASLKTALSERLKGKTPEGLGGTGNLQNDLRDQIAKGIRGGN